MVAEDGLHERCVALDLGDVGLGGGEGCVRERQDRYAVDGVESVEEACGGEDALEGGEVVAVEGGDEAAWDVDDGVENLYGAISDSCRADDV